MIGVEAVFGIFKVVKAPILVLVILIIVAS